MDLKVNPERYEKYGENNITGFFVRAQYDNKRITTDIINLTEDSLIEWLKNYSRDGIIYVVLKLVKEIDYAMSYE